MLEKNPQRKKQERSGFAGFKLFLRSEIEKLVGNTKQLFDLLINQSEKYKADLLQG